MRRQYSMAILAGIFLTSMVMFQNCSQVAFTPDTAASSGVNGAGDPNDGGIDPTCRTDDVTATADVKVLFVVDASGSNINNGNTVGTDNDQVWRKKTMNTFISTYQNKNNFYYGLISFQDSSAKAHIQLSGKGVFTNNMSAVSSGMTSFDANQDGGSTPYKPAIDMAKDIILRDMALGSSKPVAYVVVMISDGVPKDSRYTGSGGIANLKTDTQSLMDVGGKGNISVNSVLLYNTSAPSLSDEDYLKAMAQVGKGAYIKADSNGTLSIADTVKVPGSVCQ
jgi:Mg-chelatase subunit ChlD